MSEKIKRATRTRHVHAQSSIDPLAQLAYAYGAEKRIQTTLYNK